METAMHMLGLWKLNTPSLYNAATLVYMNPTDVCIEDSELCNTLIQVASRYKEVLTMSDMNTSLNFYTIWEEPS